MDSSPRAYVSLQLWPRLECPALLPAIRPRAAPPTSRPQHRRRQLRSGGPRPVIPIPTSLTGWQLGLKCSDDLCSLPVPKHCGKYPASFFLPSISGLHGLRHCSRPVMASVMIP